jgi:hypothetical protein
MIEMEFSFTQFGVWMKKLCLPEDCDPSRVKGPVLHLSTSSDQHQTFLNASTLFIVSMGTKSMGQTLTKLVRPHLLGPAAPTKVVLPISCHYQSHEKVTNEREVLISSWFDQKAKVGSTWIDGPTLNRHNTIKE